MINQCDPGLGEDIVSFDVRAVMLLMCVISLNYILSCVVTDRPPPSIPIRRHAASAWKLISAVGKHFRPRISTEALILTVHLSTTAQLSIVPEILQRTSCGRTPRLVISQDIPSDRYNETGSELDHRLSQLSSTSTPTATSYPSRRFCLSMSPYSRIA